MEAAADGEGKGSSSFRCADAARYAVASVVTILIVVVVVKAVTVLRPIPLYLSVPGGSVFVTPSASNDKVPFHFSLRAENPSKRVHMYYTGVWGRLYGRNMSAPSKSGYIIIGRFLIPNDLSLSELSVFTLDATVGLLRFPGTGRSQLFDMLATSSGSGIITDLMLRLNGTLITRTTPRGSNTTGRVVSFYCRPLLVLASARVNESLNTQDAFCVSGGTPRLRSGKP